MKMIGFVDASDMRIPQPSWEGDRVRMQVKRDVGAAQDRIAKNASIKRALSRRASRMSLPLQMTSLRSSTQFPAPKGGEFAASH
jgi:hypothetical protein